MTSPLKILHIDTEKTWRGGEAQAFHLCCGLHARRVEQIVACQPGSPFGERIESEGIETLSIQMRGEFDILSARSIAALCRRKKIDLIHAHDAHAHALGWMAGLWIPGTPVLVTRRVDFAVGGNFFSARKYRSQRINFIAISHGVKKVLIRGGVAENNISVVFSGIDPNRFKKDSNAGRFKEQFQIKEDEIVIGNVAALTDHKGQIYLIDAAPEIFEKYPNARIFILGEGELRDTLQERIVSLGLQDKVILTGFIEKIGDAYAAMDLFVISSHLEGLCTSILDAMVMEVPVVATRTGGVPDAVIDGETGRLVEPRNPQALADAVCEVLGSPDQRSSCVRSAKNRVLKDFTTDKMVEGTLTVYKKILNR